MKTPVLTEAIAKIWTKPSHDQDEARTGISPARSSLSLAGVMMLGIVIGRNIGPDFNIVMLAILFGFLALAGLIAAIKGFHYVMIISILAAVMTAGMMLILRQDGIPPPASSFLEGKQSFTAEVVMAEVMTRERQRLRIRAESADGDRSDYRMITSSSLPHVEPGNLVHLTGRLQSPLEQLLPGGFDFTAHAHRQGYVATGFINEIELRGKAENPSFVAKMRYGVQKRLYQHLSPQNAAVASAVLIGLRGGITSEMREVFRGSGLAHLLAISGLHMALFWGSVVAVVRGGLALFPHFSSRYSSLKLATICAAPFGVFYLVLSGMPISAIRAFLMLALVMVAILLTRRGLTLHHVALVAMGILVVQPSSLFLPAFQMSFAAVFALVAGWMVATRSRFTGINLPKPIRYLCGIIGASFLASSASAPFVLHHFGVTTFWSLLANMAGMPLMGFVVMPFGALALLLMPLGLEALPLAVMSLGLDILIKSGAYFASLPFARLAIAPPSGLVLCFITAAMITVVILRRHQWPIMKIVPLALLLVSVGVWITTPKPIATMTSLHGRITVAIKDIEGAVYVSRAKLDPFTKSILLRPLGAADSQYLGKIDCDDCGRGWVSLQSTSGVKVAMVWRKSALGKACSAVDIVLTQTDANYPCRSGALLIDAKAIKAKGGALIYANDNQITAHHVRP